MDAQLKVGGRTAVSKHFTASRTAACYITAKNKDQFWKQKTLGMSTVQDFKSWKGFLIFAKVIVAELPLSGLDISNGSCDAD